jgi:hypothetical protein
MKTSSIRKIRVSEPPPAGLGTAGLALWEWLAREYDGRGVEPMTEELCRLADRLAGLRAAIERDGDVLPGGKKNPAVDLELKRARHTRASGACWD